MELEQLDIPGLENIYSISTLKREFCKEADEEWKDNPPYKRYQKKIISNLTILNDYMEKAIKLKQFERVNGRKNLFSIRDPKTPKNVRIIYTYVKDANQTYAILLTAFTEKNGGDYRVALDRAEIRLGWLNEK